MSTITRIDIELPYQNALVVLNESGRYFVRLLMIRDGRKTLVTPKLSIEEQDLTRLMHEKYVEIQLGELRLSAEPTHLAVHWEVFHLPADNTIWKPKLRKFMAQIARVSEP